MSKDSIQIVFARNLRSRRKKLGLTQSELAERIGVSTSFITEIETGKKAPSFTTIERISIATGAPAWTFFCEHGTVGEEGIRNLEALSYTLKESVFNAIDEVLKDI